jgi:hypothetical protein
MMVMMTWWSIVSCGGKYFPPNSAETSCERGTRLRNLSHTAQLWTAPCKGLSSLCRLLCLQRHTGLILGVIVIFIANYFLQVYSRNIIFCTPYDSSWLNSFGKKLFSAHVVCLLGSSFRSIFRHWRMNYERTN